MISKQFRFELFFEWLKCCWHSDMNWKIIPASRCCGRETPLPKLPSWPWVDKLQRVRILKSSFMRIVWQRPRYYFLTSSALSLCVTRWCHVRLWDIIGTLRRGHETDASSCVSLIWIRHDNIDNDNIDNDNIVPICNS